MSLPQSAMDPYVIGFREQPKKWFHGFRPFAYDAHGRLWVATTRDHDRFSYFEVDGTDNRLDTAPPLAFTPNIMAPLGGTPRRGS